MTINCRDSDDIPKVIDAGLMFEQSGCNYQLMHNGIKIVQDCYYGAWMTEIIRQLRGHHEPQEEKVFDQLVRLIPDGGTMLELGSFWAYYSLWFQKMVKNANNFLIEPDPNNLGIGQKNFKLNNMKGDFFQAAISRMPVDSIDFRCESDSVVRQIPLVSVDSFVKLKNISSIDMLLCDIQGYELEMLQGASGCIEQGVIRFVIISTHHHSISNDPLTHQNCVKFLLDKGAHIIAKHNVTESFSGDGLICASFKEEDKSLETISLSYNYPTNSLFRELEYDLAQARQKLKVFEQQQKNNSSK